MQPDTDRATILRQLGLSEYAARAYLALLELGVAEARDVSRLAKVPVAKVYSTLDQLALKGYVVIVPETPRRYAAEPMSRVMKRIEEEHLARARETSEKAGQIAGLFPLAVKDHASDRGTTTVYRGRRVSADKHEQLARDARDILTLASDQSAQRMQRGAARVPDARVRCMLVDSSELAALAPSPATAVRLPTSAARPTP